MKQWHKFSEVQSVFRTECHDKQYIHVPRYPATQTLTYQFLSWPLWPGYPSTKTIMNGVIH